MCVCVGGCGCGGDGSGEGGEAGGGVKVSLGLTISVATLHPAPLCTKRLKIYENRMMRITCSALHMI